MTPSADDVLHRQREIVLDELRRRVGTTFTLAELVAAYAASEHWVREVIEERAPLEGLGPHRQPLGRRRVPRLQHAGAGLRAVTIDPLPPARRRAARRRLWPRVVALVVGAAILFALGVALGLALDDRPVPGGTQTYVRTLQPLPQQTP